MEALLATMGVKISSLQGTFQYPAMVLGAVPSWHVLNAGHTKHSEDSGNDDVSDFDSNFDSSGGFQYPF
jgi:hypothetical protein